MLKRQNTFTGKPERISRTEKTKISLTDTSGIYEVGQEKLYVTMT